MHVTDGGTEGLRDGQNYDSQDRASIAASRGKITSYSPYVTLSDLKQSLRYVTAVKIIIGHLSFLFVCKTF